MYFCSYRKITSNNDEFADFSSAFTQSMSLNSNPTNLCMFYFFDNFYKLFYGYSAIYVFMFQLTKQLFPTLISLHHYHSHLLMEQVITC